MACRDLAKAEKLPLLWECRGQLHYHAYRLSLFESVRQFVKDFRAAARPWKLWCATRYMPFIKDVAISGI